ncbi:AB24G protein, partial [Rostratula benghalensis]|nr:AB24G protein [Rostratula benghalensis]
QDKCFPCPAGFHCSKGLRRRCPPGFYCPQKTGIRFYPCPPGTYNPSYGLSQAERCQQCPAGYYCDSQQGPVVDVTLYPCPQGFYCPPGTNRSTQYSCPAGTFGPRQKLKTLKECQRCPPGKYCEFSGLAAPTGPCGAGFYCSGGVSGPTPTDGLLGNACPKGTYCPLGSAFPQPCPPGYYSNSAGNTGIEDCLPCDAGTIWRRKDY